MRGAAFRESWARRPSALHRENAITAEPWLETTGPQTIGHLTRHVAAARELVGRAGVVEQPPAAFENARELVVEALCIQLTGDTEARRIMQDRIHRGGRQ